MRWMIVAVVFVAGCQPDKLDLGDAPFKCSAVDKQCPPYYECRKDIDPDPNPATRGICVPRGTCPSSVPGCKSRVDQGVTPDRGTKPDFGVTPDQGTPDQDTGVTPDTLVVEDISVVPDSVPVDSVPADSVVDYQKTFPQLNFRGTPNSWGNEPMKLVDHHTWEVTVTFSGAQDDRFKFDVHGDWKQAYGDDEGDGICEQPGSDIKVTAAGNYVISFNDKTKAYEIKKK
jgi:hypothetical protein